MTDKILRIYEEINTFVMTVYLRNTDGILKNKLNEFLEKREINPSTAKLFNLGISSNTDQIVSGIKSFRDEDKRDIWLSLALIMGIIKAGANGLEDSYKDRIIFPIINKSGVVLGFSTRKMCAKSSGPNYMNSPESVILTKSNILYGEDLVLNENSVHESLIIVEGVTDVIRMFECGYTNVLGLLGVSLSDGNIKSILAKSKLVFMALDNDEAGRIGSEKIAKRLIERGCVVKQVELSPYKDPDDFLTTLSKEEFDKRMTLIE